MRKARQTRAVWWTRERVIDGLRCFYREFKIAPTSSEHYAELTAGTAINQSGVGNPYPTFAGVLKYFPTFRQAWTAAGVHLNRLYEEWTPEEESFLREAAGILTRIEIAEVVNRTPNAVHRRLYDLGINSRQAQGWTFNRIERVAQISSSVLRRYAEQGLLPYKKGSVCLFVDPADLLVIKEINWEHPPAELAEAVRRSLMERAVKILRGQDWRAGRLYQPHPTRMTGQRRTRATSATQPKPADISAGDLVEANPCSADRPDLAGRIGQAKLVYYSRYKNLDRPPCWQARIEYKRDGDKPRLHVTLPLTVLIKSKQGANLWNNSEKSLSA